MSDSPPWSTTTKALVATTALLLFVLVIWRFRTLISPIIVAVIVAYLINPLVSWTERRTGLKRGSAVLAVYAALFLLLVGGGILVGYAASEQATRLWTTLPDLIPRSLEEVEALLVDTTGTVIAIGPYQLDLSALLLQPDWQVLTDQALQYVEPVFSTGGSVAAQVAGAAISTVGLALLSVVLSIYIARDIPLISGAIGNFAHQPGYRRDAERLMDDFGRIWSAYLRGQVLLAIIIGVAVSVILGLLGVSNALALGMLSGVMEFLPILGPPIATAVAVIVALFQDGNMWGFSPLVMVLLVLAVMIVVQVVEGNVLVPRIVGDALDLHPLLVMISVLMGASLAGILGAILAAPVVASIKLIGVYAWRKILDLPPFADEDSGDGMAVNEPVHGAQSAAAADTQEGQISS